MAKISAVNGPSYTAEEETECPGNSSSESLPKREPKTPSDSNESAKPARMMESRTEPDHRDSSTARSTSTSQTRKSK